MTKIKKLYEKSIEKWKDVLLLLHAGEIRVARELAGKYCAFCKDVMEKREIIIINCEKCRINHAICAMGLPAQPHSLVSKVYGMFENYFGFSDITLYDLVKKVREILIALRKEWKKEEK